MHLQHWLLAGLAVPAFAAPHETRQTRVVKPQLKLATLVGNATDPTKDRDSCGSVRVGSRVFWTCRDTMAFVNGADQFPIYVNTAAWSGLGSSVARGAAKGVGSNGTNPVLSMYSGPLQEYYPVQSDNCPQNHGVCSDGTRWAIWPNTQPIITGVSSTTTTMHTFIAKSKIQGLTALNNPPPYTLYKQVYTQTSDRNRLPTVTVVRNIFWQAGEIGFGDYGSVVRNGFAYLYGISVEGSPPALARVPVGSIENKAAYQYYVSGKWTSTIPKRGDTNAIIANCGAGWQGTYYYSTYYSRYIWIGQKYGQPVAWFYITTAPAPEGPWVAPYLLYKGQDGDGFVGAYSLQAHPSLLGSTNAAENAIYLTHTQVFAKGPYITPLTYLQFT